MFEQMTRSKDFWAGVIYIAIATFAFWFAMDYPLGTAGRMGPGYFPRMLAIGLGAIGVLSIGRAVLSNANPVEPIRWQPLILIMIACAAFGALVRPAGLVIALMALVLISAAASRRFRFEWTATAGLVALIAFCVIVFVKGLGVPMPILGSWFEALFGGLPAWLS